MLLSDYQDYSLDIGSSIFVIKGNVQKKVINLHNVLLHIHNFTHVLDFTQVYSKVCGLYISWHVWVFYENQISVCMCKKNMV